MPRTFRWVDVTAVWWSCVMDMFRYTSFPMLGGIFHYWSSNSSYHLHISLHLHPISKMHLRYGLQQMNILHTAKATYSNNPKTRSFGMCITSRWALMCTCNN